jgi:hypothetical protein
MNASQPIYCTAFEGYDQIATGELAEVAARTKDVLDRGERAPVLIFDDCTSELVEVDFRGSLDDVLERLAVATPEAPAETPSGPRGPGRPRLGVVPREVTLLPKHWEWLGGQPGGASVALRKLVEHAMRANADADERRRSQEAAYRFLSAMGGNLPGFEEATRALFANDAKKFTKQIAGWPAGIRDHALKLTNDWLGR